MALSDLRRLLISLRHTRLRQLMHRLRLMTRRRLNERISGFRRMQKLHAGGLIDQVADPMPEPVFPPRRGMFQVVGAENFSLCFLNHTERFSFPIDWHRATLQIGTKLWLLHQHYMEFLEETNDEMFQRVVTDWIQQCPPYRPKYWHYDWNSYALSIRVVVWMQQFAVRERKLESSFRKMILDSLKQQLRFLARNLELDIGGNHLIKNLKAQLWAGTFFEDRESRNQAAKAERLLRQELGEQILSDGMHYERSPAYHCQAFADILEIQSVARTPELRREIDGVLAKMAAALEQTIHPDGCVSLFNDGGLHMARSPQLCLTTWTNKTGQTVESSRKIELAEAGYFGIRRGGDMLLVDCGAIAPDFLPAHGHGDILAFELSLDGQRVIIDHGVYEYNPGEMRRMARATESHNTVTVDNESQCDFWSSFRVARRARPVLDFVEYQGDGMSLSGHHDGYRHLPGRPIHHRRIVADSPADFTVYDEIKGGRGQEVASRLLVHPEVSIASGNGGLVLQGPNVGVTIESDCSYSIRDYLWCCDFGKKTTCPQIVFRYGNAPCSRSFRIRRLG